MTDVYIISNHHMFSHGLEQLLDQETDVNIVGKEIDSDQALQQINMLRPDVILVYTDEKLQDSRFQILKILEKYPDISVIGMSVHNNVCYSYRVSRWVNRKVSDLLGAIREKTSITGQLNDRMSGSASHSFEGVH